MTNTSTSLCLAFTLIALLSTSGCHGNKDHAKLGTASTDTPPRDTDELPHLTPDVIACGFGSSGLDTVYFDFDSTALTSPARTTLATNAERILEVPDVVVQIAGHCDERGTQEYNLALGERRAQGVRNHLRQLGVPGDRLVTISYGEEMPAAGGSTEAAWALNRRCEFQRAQGL